MKDRLHKATLKVNGVDFSSGRQLLERLHTNDARRYPLDGGVRLSVFTNQGTLHVQTAPSFVFDGRSGPRIVDWYAPNLGNIVLPRLIKSPYKTKEREGTRGVEGTAREVRTEGCRCPLGLQARDIHLRLQGACRRRQQK